MSLSMCWLVVLNQSSHYRTWLSTTNRPLNIFTGLARRSCVHFSTLLRFITIQLFLNAYIAVQARIIDLPVPPRPPRKTLLHEGVAQLKLAKQGICLQIFRGGVVGSYLKRAVKSSAEGSISIYITLSMTWSAIAKTSSNRWIFCRRELTSVSQMTELPQIRIKVSLPLKALALAQMQFDTYWKRIGQRVSLLTHSKRSSGVRLQICCQSTGCAFCSVFMRLVMPMDSLRIIMQNFSVTSYYFSQMPKALFLKTVRKSQSLKMMQEPTSQQVCSLIVLRMVGLVIRISSSCAVSGSTLQLLISSSSQKRRRQSRRRQEVTSYLRSRGLERAVRFFLSSSIQTDYSILGRMLVMYFLKESTGWYLRWEVAMGRDLPASLFLTTSSINPDFMMVYIQLS